jgi:hypothetical protein
LDHWHDLPQDHALESTVDDLMIDRDKEDKEK